MSAVPPTTSQLAGVRPTQQRVGQWGMWTRVDLNMQSRGPLGPQDVVLSNPILAVGFTAFQLECIFTGDHDILIEAVMCDPFSGAALPASFQVAEPINGVTESVVFTFGDQNGASANVVGAWHTLLFRFTVVDTITTTKITADLRAG